MKNTPDYKVLLTWNKKKGITLGEAISNDKIKYDLLQLLRIYQDIGAIYLKDILPINLITYQIKL